jgi:hypothetical protein
MEVVDSLDAALQIRKGFKSPFGGCMRKTISIMILGIFIAVAAFAAEAETNAKPAWEWTLEERIAARTDRALAAKRIQAALAEQVADEGQAKVSAGKYRKEPSDVIDGNRNPELFLPTELFESALTLGLVLPDNWQDVWAEGLGRSGLPSDFWQRLPVIADHYLKDLRHQQDLLERGKGTVADVRARYNRQIAGFTPTLCRERAEALAAARAAFGPALDRFLYETIAGGRSLTFFDELQDADRLRAEAGGCR